ncbi:MAG: cyclic nucleotide-binding domain-containing protein [Proteobacteria bacterium]|nr:cyclic nucleotide-binding domain-containing protein [Pseudomonadota bacterium]
MFLIIIFNVIINQRSDSRLIVEKTSILQNVYIFKDLTLEELNKISNISTLLEMKSGQKLFSENDDSDALYIVKQGSVMVKKGSIVLSVLNEGECIGEITFINREKRTATITVIENTSILKIKYKDLDELIKEDAKIASKIYKAIALTLSKRLKEMTENVEKRFQPLKFL